QEGWRPDNHHTNLLVRVALAWCPGSPGSLSPPAKHPQRLVMQVAVRGDQANAIQKILDCLGLPTRSPPISPAVKDNYFD
ncbi:MAG: hypothetical protein P8Z37_08475, partial [Acidobacteriota bacterium]